MQFNLIGLLSDGMQMTEEVGSYLELYTTLFGAKAGEDFFTLFWAIGLYKIGFVMVGVFTLIDAFKKGGADGGWYFIRTIAVRMLALFVVMLIFVWPSMKLDMANIKYDPPSTFATAAESGGEPVTIYDRTTTYGQSGFKPNQYDVKVSIAQRLAMAVGHGINRATTKLLASQTSMRLLDEGLSTMKIDDPALKQELVEFNQECYIPAINKWKTFWRESGKPIDLQTLEAIWKQTDLTYIGSRVLMDTPGLYAPCPNPSQCGSSLQSSRAVAGFPWSNARDGEPMAYQGTPQNGMPYCNQWWTSIKGKLWNTQINALDDFNYILRDNGYASLIPGTAVLGFYGAEDQLIKISMERNRSDYEMFSSDLTYNTGVVKNDSGMLGSTRKAATNAFTTAVGWVGTVGSQPLASVENMQLNNLTQISQAITLLALYLLWPFVAVFSGMKWEVMATYAILVLSVVSWQLWWTVTIWIDSNLLMSMYPDTNSMMAQMEDFGTKRILLNRVTNTMALLAPMIWSFVLTFAGYKGATAMQGVTSQLGSQAASIATKTAKTGMDLATTLASKIPGGSKLAAGLKLVGGNKRL